MLGNLENENCISFEAKKCRSPTEIVCLASSFITYWAGLQKTDEKLELETGVEALWRTRLYSSIRRRPPWRHRSGAPSVACGLSPSHASSLPPDAKLGGMLHCFRVPVKLLVTLPVIVPGWLCPPLVGQYFYRWWSFPFSSWLLVSFSCLDLLEP